MLMRLIPFVLVACWTLSLHAEEPRKPIPDKLVVLTFDDSVKSHYTVVRPILKQYKFNATFFITEGFDFKTNKDDYMTWAQIKQLHEDGFEIGNHTKDHVGISESNLKQVKEQLEHINRQCKAHGIPRTVSFAYPGNQFHEKGFAILNELGIQFARRGGAPEYPYDKGKGFAYQPGLDHPLLIPSAGDARPKWKLENFIAAVSQAKHGRIAVLQFHGVPDKAHPWVHTSVDLFRAYMNYLAVNGFKVIAMRDLAQYVDPSIAPKNPLEVVEDRKAQLKANKILQNVRTPASEGEAEFWIKNMVGDHRYRPEEVAAATGWTLEEVIKRIGQAKVVAGKSSAWSGQDAVKVLPYPGGRHPRIGFLDGAMRPQRETKFSAFTPWDPSAYVVVDVPEAIWFQPKGQRALLYLAHTHVPTFWSRQGIDIKPLEWKRLSNGGLSIERKLPNNVSFGAEVKPQKTGVFMELWIKNGSKETLTGLNVQNCVMLKGSKVFEELTNENKVLRSPFAACANQERNRWVITGWENCVRPWGNTGCPCLHADPQFPDCPPGETRRLKGWVSFYQGTDIEAEMDRLKKVFADKATQGETR